MRCAYCGAPVNLRLHQVGMVCPCGCTVLPDRPEPIPAVSPFSPQNYTAVINSGAAAR
jgi:hypothetical protein